MSERSHAAKTKGHGTRGPKDESGSHRRGSGSKSGSKHSGKSSANATQDLSRPPKRYTDNIATKPEKKGSTGERDTARGKTKHSDVRHRDSSPSYSSCDVPKPAEFSRLHKYADPLWRELKSTRNEVEKLLLAGDRENEAEDIEYWGDKVMYCRAEFMQRLELIPLIELPLVFKYLHWKIYRCLRPEWRGETFEGFWETRCKNVGIGDIFFCHFGDPEDEDPDTHSSKEWILLLGDYIRGCEYCGMMRGFGIAKRTTVKKVEKIDKFKSEPGSKPWWNTENIGY